MTEQITIAEAADLTARSTATIRRWIREGKLAATSSGVTVSRDAVCDIASKTRRGRKGKALPAHLMDSADERVSQIAALRARGWTWRQIGTVVDVSYQRAHQLAHKGKKCNAPGCSRPSGSQMGYCPKCYAAIDQVARDYADWVKSLSSGVKNQ